MIFIDDDYSGLGKGEGDRRPNPSPNPSGPPAPGPALPSWWDDALSVVTLMDRRDTVALQEKEKQKKD